MGITSRIDAITHLPADRLMDKPPAPKSVKIELTSQCNYSCEFCSIKNRAIPDKQVMSLEFFKSITHEMYEAGVEEIGLFYIGESFMQPKLLLECVKYLKQELCMPYVFLTTNGSLAHPKTVDALMEAGLDSLKWSLNAADEQQFDRVMRSPTKLFHKALENLKAARQIRDEKGYKCGIYASSIQYDGEQGERMQALLDAHVLPYVDEHYFLPLYGRMAQQPEERAKMLGFEQQAGNQGRIGGLVKPLPCWAVLSEGHVRVDGHLSACCFGADDKYDMGSLHETSFMNAWHSNQFVALRQAHLKGNIKGTVCEGCVAYS